MLAFSALADPTRLRIVEMLASQGQLAATDISRRFPISAPAVSQHLKVLRESGLVAVETRAQQRIYSFNPAGIGEMEHWLQQMRQMWNDRFDALDALLKDEMKKRKPRRRPRHDHRP